MVLEVEGNEFGGGLVRSMLGLVLLTEQDPALLIRSGAVDSLDGPSILSQNV